MKYWEFTEETKVSFSGEKLRRIICTQDFLHAKKGDLGGWLGENAVLKDTAWIADEAQVFDNAKVFGNAIVGGFAKVFDNAEVFGNAKVYGYVKVFDNAKVFGYAKVYGYAKVGSYVKVFDNAKVFDKAIVGGFAKVFDKAKVFDNAIVGGNAKIGGNQEVYGGDEVLTNTVFSKKIEESEKKKTINDNNIGHKETEGKLPMYTVLFKQFPNAMSEIFLTDTPKHFTKLNFLDEAIIKLFKGDIIGTLLNILKAISDGEKGLNTIYTFLNFPESLQRVAQCSVLGHEKYKNFDQDWQNFAKVPDAYNHYLNAAVRHFLEGDKINEEDSTDAIKVNHLDQAAWNFMAAIELESRANLNEEK